MENDASSHGAYPSGTDAQQVLSALDSDRAALADRLQAPWWLHAVVALIVAGYVALPALWPDGVRWVAYGLVVCGGFAAQIAYRRIAGVRVSKRKVWQVELAAGAALAALLLLLISTSFGLVASLSPWWVLAPTTAAFAIALVLSRWFERIYREALRRDR